MAATTSRSHVRSRLLLALRQKPIDNLAALARELQVKRPSVSRAMHALSAEGLVSKVDEFWQLTPSGEAAALLVIDDLPERVQRTSVTVRRLMAQSELAAPSTQPLIRDMIAPIREAAATALALRFAPDLQLLSPMQDSMRSFLAAQDRQFAEVTKSLSSSVVDRAHLDSVHERFLAEGAKLAQMASAYDGAAAQVAKSAQAYESTVASAMREANALPSAQLAIARLADLLPATKLIDMALPSAETLDAIKQLALVPSPLEVAATYARDIRDSLSTFGPQLVHEAMTSFVESQRLNLSLIARAAGQQGAHSGIMRVFDTTNRHLGRILSDLGAVHIRAFDPSDRVLLADQLMPDVAAVARSYRSYLTEVAADLVRHEADLRLVPIEMPTRTTAGLIQTIRTAIVLEQDDTDEVPSDVASRTSFWEQRAGLVSQVLAKQGPQFVRLWEGSWAVLESASPDRVRQAAHSGRELLMQLLALLAPDHAFTEDELKSQPKGKPTRKMRIRYILTNRSSATVQLIDSIAAALDGLYDRLAGISHDRSVVPLTTEQMITGWLMTLGGLLMLLLDDGHLPE